MKILVPTKCVIDYHTPQFLNPLAIDDKTPTAMNPFDEVALERAVRLKEAHHADSIIAISIGGDNCQAVLRTALAMGADRAIWIQHPNAQGELDALAIAKILAHIVQTEHIDLVLLGKQAIDDDVGATGQLLAAKLDAAQATFASQLTVNEDKSLTVNREVDGGQEVLKLSLPAVITADLRLNDPRIPSLRDIMRAKGLTIETLSSEQLALDVTPRLQCLNVREADKRRKAILVKDADELLEKLRAENVL